MQTPSQAGLEIHKDLTGYLADLDKYQALNGQLSASPPSELGGPILQGTRRLARLPHMEGKIIRVPSALIDENPTQPRTQFRGMTIEELAGSIAFSGLEKVLEAIPHVSTQEDQQEPRLFLLDGARRLRATRLLGAEEVPVLIRWAPKDSRVFVSSYLANCKREDHTVMEHARALQRMKGDFMDENPGSNIGDIFRYLNGITGFNQGKIRLFLKLLELPPEIQEKIESGKLKPTSVMHAVKGSRRGRPSEEERQKNMLLGAATILAALSSDKHVEDEAAGNDTSSAPPKRVTGRDLSERRRRAAIEGDDAALKATEVDRAILEVRRRVSGLPELLAYIMKSENAAAVRASMRNFGIGRPPELLRDESAALSEQMDEFAELINTVVSPDPLPQVPGAPTFEHFVEALIKPQSEVSATVKKIILVLAQASDSKKVRVYTPSEIAEKTGIEVSTVGTYLKGLYAVLREYGLGLDKHSVRKKDARNKYELYDGYRLKLAENAPAFFGRVRAAVPLTTPQPVAPAKPSSPKPTTASQPQRQGAEAASSAARAPRADIGKVSSVTVLNVKGAKAVQLTRGEAVQPAALQHVAEYVTRILNQSGVTLHEGVATPGVLEIRLRRRAAESNDLVLGLNIHNISGVLQIHLSELLERARRVNPLYDRLLLEEIKPPASPL